MANYVFFDFLKLNYLQILSRMDLPKKNFYDKFLICYSLIILHFPALNDNIRKTIFNIPTTCTRTCIWNTKYTNE